MATSVTFKGAPKPYGATGHFDEPTRHALQAKGIKTGNLADAPAVYEQWGISNLERTATTPDTTPRTSGGLENIEEEAKQEKAPPKESLSSKFKRMRAEFERARKREQALKAKQRQREIYEGLDKEQPATEEVIEERPPESVTSRMGEFLADVTAGWSSQDMVTLNNAELEQLAIRFRTQTKDSMFGTPENPFLDELKSRVRAEEQMKAEKARVTAEIREEIAHPKPQKGFLSDFFGVGEQGSEPKEPKGKGLIQDIMGE